MANDERLDEQCLRLADALARETRYGIRRLAHDWRFTLLAIAILALGIGVNTAMFSIVNAMFARPLPFDDAHQLVNIYQNDRDSGQPLTSSYPAYQDMAAYTELYSSVTAFSVPVPVRFYQDEMVRPGMAEFATSTYLEVLRMNPAVGRWFTSEEDRLGAEAVAVLSYEAWTRKFGGSPSVIGEVIRINGVQVMVVGVGPEGHRSSFHAGVVTDFWLSMPSIVTVVGQAVSAALERDAPLSPFMVKARLRDGVSVAQAQAAMTALGATLAREFPDADPGRGISVLRSESVRVHPQLDGVLNYGAWTLMSLVGLLLAIACTNLATWLLVRGLSRAKEMSVRLALGATRGQLVRQLLVESTLLAVTGGAVGCVLAVWTIRLVARIDLPLDAGLGLDYRVLAFTLLLSLATGLLFGLTPALKATRTTLTPGLRAEEEGLVGGRRGLTLKNGLVVSQVALSCVLLLWGGVMLERLVTGQRANLGYSIDRLAFVETDASVVGYSADEAAALYQTWVEQVLALPGVEAATRAAGPPLGLSEGRLAELVIDGYEPAEDELTRVSWNWAGPRYFETLGVPLLYGRTFTDFDRTESPRVAVVNESMAHRYFGSPNPVGRRFRLANTSGTDSEGTPGAVFEVIGVVADTRTSVFDEPPPLFYRSFGQGEVSTPALVVRTTLDPASLLQPLQRTLREIGGDLPIITARTMSQYVAESLGGERTAGALLAGLGSLGLVLASLGLYAVVAFGVSQRSREIGIRRALGASRAHVIWNVSRNVCVLLGVGMMLGLGLSWLSVHGAASMSSSLSQGGAVNLFVPTVSVMTYVLVTVLMTVVGAIATLLPARRAAQSDPLVALRDL